MTLKELKICGYLLSFSTFCTGIGVGIVVMLLKYQPENCAGIVSNTIGVLINIFGIIYWCKTISSVDEKGCDRPQ